MRSFHRVLTPESVEFVYEIAGPGSRMVAVLLDHLIILAGLLVVWLTACGTGLFAWVLGGPIVAAALVASFVLYFGYFAYFEWKWQGQTPAKRLMELRVIDDRGMNIDLSQAILRNLLRVVDMMPTLTALDFIAIGFYGLGAATALLNPRQKRIGDWVAGTLVVRTHKRMLPEAILPPNEKYNSLLADPALRTRIRSRLGLEEREWLFQLCLRRDQLAYESRSRLFVDAAAFLEERLQIQREEFLSEEKFVQNVTAVALDTGETSPRETGAASSPVRGPIR